ncbi:hypothetical protein JN11_00596 [Mucilaginibacter frigoritolerans]|uniref:Uncharacterized protein n=1 Tax=Mucilaginibacter frigoritolerans TaxID=652788 RepID=A0A562UGI0_9SPHI|nr:hypothetical protein [Mucilaginibacter frigoritolerans]TWJ04873.1 hypothetical protein JN11_00596 [Mucilaginibacter frigoritolerans]
MLRINVPSNTTSQVNFSTFEILQLPVPPNGVEAEINNDLILQFEDEEEAIAYADELEALSYQLTDKTEPRYLVVNDIIMAIRNDEFIQSYSR